MKKKILTLVLSAILCMGMSVTAFAAESPANTNKATGTVNGQTVDFGISTSLTMNDAQQKAMNDTLSSKFAGVDFSSMTEAEQTAKNFEVYSSFIKEQAGINVSSIAAHGFVDIVKPEGIDISAGVPITFTAPNIAAGDTIVVLHLKADGTWETISAKAGNGEITGTFTSLSPVYYFKVTVANEPTAAPNGGYSPEYYESQKAENSAVSAGTTATSPKTAETAVPFVIAAAAVVGGVAVFAKRKSLVK